MQFLRPLLFAAGMVATAAKPLHFINYFEDSPGLLEVGKAYTVDWTAEKN